MPRGRRRRTPDRPIRLEAEQPVPTISDTAICLRRWDFSETSQTVSLFTREHGMIRGLAKGAKRPKGKFSGGIDVLTRGQVVAIVKPGRDLATITEWQLQETFRVVRQRIAANRSGLYIADLVHHMLTDGDPHPRLFDALCAALDRLAEPDRTGVAVLALQWTLLEETGYRPELDHDASSGAVLPDDAPSLGFSPRAGGIVADAEAPGVWGVRRSTVELLRRLASTEPIDDAEPRAIDRANRLLAAYFRELIGRELATMRWAFSDLGA
jgi:DNA repair protein RecO (recombination protein O)